jgi:hypothetical protein
VDAGVAENFEMRRVTRLAQYGGGIAADRIRSAGFEHMLIVEYETVW